MTWHINYKSHKQYLQQIISRCENKQEHPKKNDRWTCSLRTAWFSVRRPKKVSKEITTLVIILLPTRAPSSAKYLKKKTIINVICVQSLLFLWSPWIFSNCNSLNSRRDNPGWLLYAPFYSQISGKGIMQCDIYAMCLLESFPIATLEAAEIIRADCTRVLICRWYHQGA